MYEGLLILATLNLQHNLLGLRNLVQTCLADARTSGIWLSASGSQPDSQKPSTGLTNWQTGMIT